MRNHSEKLLNVNCANSIFLKQTILGEKCAERSDKHFKLTTFERLWERTVNPIVSWSSEQRANQQEGEGHSVTYGREPSPLPLDGLPFAIPFPYLPLLRLRL